MNKLRKPLKPRSPVTIIVGLKCEDHIILACDSQTTRGNAKRTDTDKMVIVRFAENKKVLVAQAGNAVMSERAIEILQELAKNQPLIDYRTAADLAQDAMRKVKEELREQNLDCTMEELRSFILDHELDCELMIAHYFNGEPQLFSIDLIIGIATKEMSDYATIGCGANLASFILSDEPIKPMALGYGMVKAIYTIEKVKEADAYCGGPTKTASIDRDGKVAISRQDKILETVEHLKELEGELLKEKNERLHKMFLKLLSKWQAEDMVREVLGS